MTRDEALTQIEELLGNCLSSVKVSKYSRLDLYAVKDKGLVIVNVMTHNNGPVSFEVYSPLTTDMTLDGTVEAVRQYVGD